MAEIDRYLQLAAERLSDAKQLFTELKEIIARLSTSGRRLVSEILDDYETARSLVEEISDYYDEQARKIKALPGQETQRSPIEDISDRSDEIVRGLLDTLVSDMNRNLPGTVKAVYEDTRNQIEEAATAEQKLEALIEGQALLGRLTAFPEHAEHPLLQKALHAFDDYESTLQRALANETAKREEEEFRNAVAGITYTATDKQMRYLIGLGANPRDLDGITKQQASAMITRMKKG